MVVKTSHFCFQLVPLFCSDFKQTAGFHEILTISLELNANDKAAATVSINSASLSPDLLFDFKHLQFTVFQENIPAA